MTDDLLQAVRDLPQRVALPARPGAERLRRRAQAHEADVHGRLYDDMLAADSRDDPRRLGLERLHRRLLRRDGGIVREVGSTWSSGRGSRIAYLQVQPPARHEGRRPVSGRHPRRRSRSGGNNDLLAVQTASVARTTGGFSGGRSRCWSKGRASRPRSLTTTTTGNRARVGRRQLTGRTACDRIVVFDGHERLVGQVVPAIIDDAERRHLVRPGADHGDHRCVDVSARRGVAAR